MPAKSKAYTVWYAMVRRCTKPTHKDYPNYGGRGIAVCGRWLTFSNFLKDMGEPPPGLSLDRINNDGDYHPTNCRWATNLEQMRNKRNSLKVSWKGQILPLAEACALAGVALNLVKCRVYSLGWDIQRAFDTPVLILKSARPKVINAPRGTRTQQSSVNGIRKKPGRKPAELRPMCAAAGIPYHIFMARTKKLKWPVDLALSTPVGSIKRISKITKN